MNEDAETVEAAQVFDVLPVTQAIDRLAAAVNATAPPKHERIEPLKQPERWGTGSFMGLAFRAVPGYAELFKRAIPTHYYERRGNLVLLGCPCRIVLVLGPAVPSKCKCGRWYLATETAVRVANAPGTSKLG